MKRNMKRNMMMLLVIVQQKKFLKEFKITGKIKEM